MTNKSKKIFIGFRQPGNDQTLFFRLWQMLNIEGPLAPLVAFDANPVARELERMRRQQVHIDEIKRLCHVPTD